MAVRRGMKARPTKAHESKKRYRRTDVIDDASCGDWYEQQLHQMGADQSNHKVNPPKEK